MALQQLKAHKYVDYITQAIIYKVSTLIPAEDIKTEKHVFNIVLPDGWWQAFKEEYFSDWLKKKFPIRYITKAQSITFEALALYPKLPTIMPNCGLPRHIIIKYVDNIPDVMEVSTMTRSQRHAAAEWQEVVTTPKDL